MNSFVVLKYGYAPIKATDRREWLKTLPREFLLKYRYAAIDPVVNYGRQDLYILSNGAPEVIYRDLLSWEESKGNFVDEPK